MSVYFSFSIIIIFLSFVSAILVYGNTPNLLGVLMCSSSHDDQAMATKGALTIDSEKLQLITHEVILSEAVVGSFVHLNNSHLCRCW